MQQNFLDLILPLIVVFLLLAALWRIGLRRLKTYHSPLLGKIEVWQKYNGEKLLTINNYAQGISAEKESIKQSYFYRIAKEVAAAGKNCRTPQVLMFGLGAATVPTILSRLNSNFEQTVVEIDPQIIAACRDFFNLEQIPNLRVIQADAFKIVRKARPFPEKFDAIVVDIFTGKPPYLVPGSSQYEFWRQLPRFLKPGGVIIFNRPATIRGDQTTSIELQQALSRLFKKTSLLTIRDPRGYKNHLLIVSNPRLQKPMIT